MSFTFNPQFGLIHVNAEIEGPTANIKVLLALDTAATRTVIDLSKILQAGYALNPALSILPATTASGIMSVPIFRLSRLNALGVQRTNLDIFGHSFPPTASTDGVLGLDFVRGLNLQLDFRTGTIDLS